MGYESKIFVMRRIENYPRNNNTEPIIYGIEIARFDLCKVGGTRFTQLFCIPIDFTMNGDMVGDEEADLTEDKYGEQCKYAEVSDVVEWIENQIKTDDYCRWKPFLAMLKEFNSEEWKMSSKFKQERLIVVHYGH